jgi:putative (di)nucleoside polyphosphate hydrolase
MPSLPLWSGPVIDPDGYRPNVGIVLIREDARVFWARRVARDGWQFPQGGMRTDETPLEAMYRELREETGLQPHHVEVLGATPGWLRYRLPRRYLRRHEKPMCIGQKQVWFLVRLLGQESELCLDACDKPEFDLWRWVDFWYPISHVVPFKRGVYERALTALAPMTEPLGEVAEQVMRSAPAPLAGHGGPESAERRYWGRRERKTAGY